MVELPLVQILVKVANIQMRSLKAEEDKVFMRTVIGHELVGLLRYWVFLENVKLT